MANDQQPINSAVSDASSSSSSSSSDDRNILNWIGDHSSISNTWFEVTQMKRVRLPDGTYPVWFHGVMPHGEAERLLQDQAKGCFLLRVSDQDPHFSLSIKAKVPPDKEVKHYRLRQTRNGNYLIIGEGQAHITIVDLIQYYHHNQISNWDGFLTEPLSVEEPGFH